MTISITGAAYDYEQASINYKQLHTLSCANDLRALLPAGVTLNDVGESLTASLTSLIALPWTTAASKNQQDALVSDVMSRMPKKKTHLAHHHGGAKEDPAKGVSPASSRSSSPISLLKITSRTTVALRSTKSRHTDEDDRSLQT